MRNNLYFLKYRGLHQNTKKKAVNPPESQDIKSASIFRCNDGDREYNT